MLKFLGFCLMLPPGVRCYSFLRYLLSEIFASLGRFSYLKNQIAIIYLVLICNGGHFVRGVQYRKSQLMHI